MRLRKQTPCCILIALTGIILFQRHTVARPSAYAHTGVLSRSGTRGKSWSRNTLFTGAPFSQGQQLWLEPQLRDCDPDRHSRRRRQE
jgi:hypothetical protein